MPERFHGKGKERHMHDLLDTKAAAPRIGVSPGTLENWRVQGLGPKFIKASGRRGKVLYDPADIEAWKDANRFQSTSEAM
jgi:DNA-binding transcriptional MerR regulator